MGENLSPLVSVIMPVYNCALYVKDAVESILQQTFTNFELIIIDDCSTDNTGAIIQSLKDDRIQLIQKPVNTGYTDSLNLGIELAKGVYIARMDGDDIAETNRLQVQYDFMEKNTGTGVCGSWYTIIGTNETITAPVEFEEIKITSLEYNPVAHPTVFIRRSILKDHSPVYKKDLEPSEDYDLWCRLYRVTKIVNLPLTLLKYRRHSSQASFVRSEKQTKTASAIRVSLLQHITPDFHIDLEKENLQKWLVSNGQQMPELTSLVLQLHRLNEKNKTTRFFDTALFRNYLTGKQMEIIRFYLQEKKAATGIRARVGLLIHFMQHRRSYLVNSKQLVKLLIRNR